MLSVTRRVTPPAIVSNDKNVLCSQLYEIRNKFTKNRFIAYYWCHTNRIIWGTKNTPFILYCMTSHCSSQSQSDLLNKFQVFCIRHFFYTNNKYRFVVFLYIV